MRLQHTSQATKIILIVEFLLVAYLLYALTVNVYKSYTLDAHIKTFEQENISIEDENSKKNADFQYYTSEQYIDKIAKQNFGLVNPGEEVIILPVDPNSQVSADGTVTSAASKDDLSQLSNPQKWWKFFFDR